MERKKFVGDVPENAITIWGQKVTRNGNAGEGRISPLISFDLSQFIGQEVDVIVIPKAG